MRRLLILSLLAVASASCHADWVPRFASGTFTGTMSYNGSSVSTAEVMTTAGTTSGPMSTFARQTNTLPSTLKSTLDTQFRALASQNGATFNSSTISGPLNASISGLTGPLAGNNRMAVGGPSYGATFTKSSSYMGLGVTCTATLKATNVSFVIVYNPYTGVINTDPKLSNVQLNGSSTAYCDNSLDWIPIIGDLINNYAAGLVESALNSKMASVSTDLIAKAVPYGPNYLGLFTTIPPGKYIVNGLDVGLYLQNNFATYFTGRTFSLSLGPFVPAQIYYGYGEPTKTTYVSNVLSVDFSDPSIQLSFTIKDTRNYAYSFACSATDPNKRCQTP